MGSARALPEVPRSDSGLAYERDFATDGRSRCGPCARLRRRLGKCEFGDRRAVRAVLACSEFVHPRVHLFSTEVTDVSFRELAAGVVRTTGGTSIECILAHMRRHDVRRAVWITDGWVGTPSKADEAWLKQRRIAVAYVGPSPNSLSIESFVVAEAVLPTGGGS